MENEKVKLSPEEAQQKLQEFISETIGLGQPTSDIKTVFIGAKNQLDGKNYHHSDTLHGYCGHEPAKLREKVFLQDKNTRVSISEGPTTALNRFISSMVSAGIVSRAGYSWEHSEKSPDFEYLTAAIDLFVKFYHKYLDHYHVHPFAYIEYTARNKGNDIIVDAILSMGFSDYVCRVYIGGNSLFSTARLNISDDQIASIEKSAMALMNCFPSNSIFDRYRADNYHRAKTNYPTVLLESLRRRLELGSVPETFEAYTRLMHRMRFDAGFNNPQSIPEVIRFDKLTEEERKYISILTSVVINNFNMVMEHNRSTGLQY